MLVTTMERNRIKDLLDQQGKTMYWLAKETGLSNQAILDLVNSEDIPGGTRWRTMKIIARALGVNIEDLEE